LRNELIDPARLIETKHVARILDVSDGTVRYLVRTGKLTVAIRLGGKPFFDRERAEALAYERAIARVA
jgi:predicted site-specific integrase-resolvase